MGPIKSPSGLYLELNGSLYNYNTTFWIRNGTYEIGGIGSVYFGSYQVVYKSNQSQGLEYSAISWDPFKFVNGTQMLSQVITINYPSDITVYYEWDVGYNQL
ncbi:hypothetical protein [Metallosphaera hakonensis]|uniref:hypothetical protein n=1 Tax=Metallosphaera hakonensis TaxID=79601 RepID=UPI0006CF8965|nr:hypothetical protein [Metallosphaera hakonensis]